MGKVACTCESAPADSLLGSMQIELLYRWLWPTRAELANAMLEWIEGWCNPSLWHSALNYL